MSNEPLAMLAKIAAEPIPADDADPQTLRAQLIKIIMAAVFAVNTVNSAIPSRRWFL